MLGLCALAALLVASPGCAGSRRAAAKPESFALGADVSFLGEAEGRGVVFRDAGAAKPGLQILRDHGHGWVRLRLFHDPSRTPRPLPNDLAYTLAQARAAKALGFKLLLDLHYSDTWADPAHQTTPAAWRDLAPDALAEAVRAYSRDTLAAFREAGALPDIVQPGNEVTAGMLWPVGRLPENPDNFFALLRAAIAGLREGAGDAPPPRILVQIERSGDVAATRWFFDRLFATGIEPDVLGQSYYPWWHGSPDDLRATLRDMAARYRKPIMVVETAYCWRPTEYVAGKTPAPAGPAPFPETPEGQRNFFRAVIGIVRDLPDGLGAGVFWWEPAVGHGRGRSHLRSRGWFDDAGDALPIVAVGDEFAR